MKTTITFIFSVLFALMLTGCAGITEVQKETVKDIRTQVVVFPDSLLEPCPVTAPPDRDTYVLTMNDKQRLEAMVGYSTDLLKDMAKCNNRLVEIRKLQEKQKKIYSSTIENH